MPLSMQKGFFLVYLLTITQFLGQPLWASLQTSHEAPAATESDHCSQDPNDPFDPHLKLFSGPKQGKCLDTSLNRSVVILKADAYSRAKNPRVVRIANFTHQNQQWIAEFDPLGVDSVIFQIVHYSSQFPTTHFQLRLQFRRNSPVSLFRQTMPTHEENLYLHDVIISIQAVFPKNIRKWDPVAGIKNNYGIAYRILSTEQRTNEMFATHHQISRIPHIEQILLNLSETQKTNILLYSILLSDQNRLNYFYHTLKRSCTTETFAILDHAILYSPLHQNWIDANQLFLTTINSLEASWILWIRGLYGKKLNDFKNELSS